MQRNKKIPALAGFCLASTWTGRLQAYPYYWVYLNEWVNRPAG